MLRVLAALAVTLSIVASAGAISSFPSDFRTEEIETNGTRLHVRIGGRGPAVVMLLGGEPIGPRFVEWNFVASSQARIDQAKADWRAGRMKLPDLDHDEFIPLPPDPPPAPSPL